MTSLEANLEAVRERMSVAAQRAGRKAADVTLVAVSKTHPPDVIRAAYDLGLRHFGENRVSEAEAKTGDLPDDITWHMIGHIQSRKAKRVAAEFQFVHSMDSVKLGQRLDRACSGWDTQLPVLLECNVSGEASKYGFSAERWIDDPVQRQALWTAVSEIVNLPHLSVQGLMTMAPILPDQEQARPIFAALRRLRDELAAAFPTGDWCHLSMGMTDDFEVAIEEGATLIRIGRAIFDPELPPWRKG